jgi:beta-lactamase regulating signal transducer with metallopeptidase domain
MERFLVELFVRGVALCLLTAATLALLRRTAAVYRHLLCVVALVGLLILPLAQRLLPPLPLLPPPSGSALQRPLVPEPAANRPFPRNTAASPTAQSPSKPGVPTSSSALLPQKPTPAAPELSALPPVDPRNATRQATVLLTALWGAGSAALFLRLLVALFRLRRLEKESRKAEIAGVPILVSARIETPLTWGIRRNVILLPTALLSAGREVCESALRHEQAHIDRRDWIWNLFAEAVCALCWFQPGAWWLRRRMRFESERACDDRVLLSGVLGADYAAHLLQIVQSVRTHEIAPAMAQGGRMEARMRHILNTNQSRRAHRLGLALAAPCGLALLSLAALRISTRPAEAQPHPADPWLKTASANVRKPIMKPQPSRPASALVAPTLAAPEMADPASAPGLQPPASAAIHSAPSAVAPRPSAPLQNNSPAATPLAAPATPLGPIVWDKAVEGLQGGMLLKTPAALIDHSRVPFNSQVSYQVLVRNTSRQERTVEVQCQDFQGMGPYIVRHADLRKALRDGPDPDNPRVLRISDLAIAFLGYAVKLAPGEAVLLPEVLHLYIGDADKESYPRLEQIPPGKHWLLQPVMVRPLTPAEAAEDLNSISSPYGNGFRLTTLLPDGTSVQRLGARLGIRRDHKKLYAKLSVEITPANAAGAPAEKPIAWGEAVKGIQLGARITQGGSVFRTGEVIKFQPFGRNQSGANASLTVGNYWKVNYKVQIQTLDGKPVYMERDQRNQRMLIAGYRGESLINGATEPISEASLRIARPLEKPRPVTVGENEDTWVEAVPLKPGRYRVRLLSWGVFDSHPQGPASGWIPIEVQN